MATNLLNRVYAIKITSVKTVQFKCSYFYRTARLWNTIPFVIRDTSSLHIKKNLNKLYLTVVNVLDGSMIYIS